MSGLNTDRDLNNPEGLNVVDFEQTFKPFGYRGKLRENSIAVTSESFILSGLGKGYVLLQDFELNWIPEGESSILTRDKATGNISLRDFSEPYAIEVRVVYDEPEQVDQDFYCELRILDMGGLIALVAKNQTDDPVDAGFAEFSKWRSMYIPEVERRIVVTKDPEILSKIELAFKKQK